MKSPFGAYELVEKLSDGGMSEVYLARARGALPELAVVKLTRTDLSPRAPLVAMMLKEARILSQLDHPNIVKMLGAGRADARGYLVLEHLRGADLGAVLRRAVNVRMRPSFGLCCRIICDVLAALEHAHTPNAMRPSVLHRDVSPRNIFITDGGCAKLIDFGIAKESDEDPSELTEAGQPKGKSSYMSPEQLLCLPLDARTDLFAVGVVLWELAAMQQLFRAPSERERRASLLAARIPPPSTLNPLVPPALDRIVLRALSRDREQRPSSAAQMRRELEELVAAQRWQATAADLARFMHELFADDRTDEITTPRGINAAPYLSIEVSVAEDGDAPSPAPPVLPLPAPTTSTRSTGRLPSTPRTAGASKRWLTMACSGLITVALLIATVSLFPVEEATSTPHVVAPIASSPSGTRPPAAIATVATPPTTTATATTSAPAAAFIDVQARRPVELFVDGAPRQTGAQVLLAVESGRRHELRYRLAGHHHLHRIEVAALPVGAVRRLVLPVKVGPRPVAQATPVSARDDSSEP